ncbi:MAG: FHA domain-containing protein [Planctomycetes bacterium]|nr:FHA domain-containing protein [Planctomycetota bacterium]
MKSGEQREGRFYFDVQGREKDGLRFQVGRNGLLIGRSVICDVVFENRKVSRRHAYFYLNEGACYVEDMGSKNGILLNGRPCKKGRMAPGDTVDIGPARFVLRAVAPGKLLSRLLARYGELERAAQPEPSGTLFSASVLPVSLALFGLAFAVLTYAHWVFGICAIVLVTYAFWEARRSGLPVPRALLAGVFVMGLTGAALNGWFETAAPFLRRQAEHKAWVDCGRNMLIISQALRRYSEMHEGQLPPGLRTLVQEGLLHSQFLHCPGSLCNGAAPCPYLYLPKPQESPPDPYGVLLCDADVSNHQARGGWVLRRNLELDNVSSSQLERLLERLSGSGRPPKDRGH